MLKSGVSYNVYMKRVWIFDETLSPACFIYYTLASPAGNSVFIYVGPLSCFRVKELLGLYVQCFEWSCREYWGTRGTLAGKSRGENKEGKTFLFPLSPTLTPFPFSLALFPLCPRPPSENVALVLRTL